MMAVLDSMTVHMDESMLLYVTSDLLVARLSVWKRRMEVTQTSIPKAKIKHKAIFERIGD